MKKRLTAIFLILATLTAFIFLAAASNTDAGEPYRLGDLDGDGKVTAADALLILKYSVSAINTFPVESLV